MTTSNAALPVALSSEELSPVERLRAHLAAAHECSAKGGVVGLQDAAGSQIAALIQFAASHGIRMDEMKHANDAVDAFCHSTDGGNPDLFKTDRQKKRPPVSNLTMRNRGIAAAMMDFRMKELGEPELQAATIVARKIANTPVGRGVKANDLAGSIINWRKHAKTGNHDIDDDAITYRLTLSLADQTQAPARDIMDGMLDLLQK
jgi:hypothetical protein